MDVHHQFEVFENGEQPNCIPEEEDAAFLEILAQQTTLYSPKWHELASATGAIPTVAEGFSFGGSKSKPKRRKLEKTEPHDGRIVRSGGDGRRDRHSKVCTARGTRDRRVRLSPRAAIQFYDVQDRLGYDRPSKAIDWLMKKAKAAIDALDAPPPLPQSGNPHVTGEGNHGNCQKLQAECEIIPSLAHLSDDIPGSGFGFFNNETQFLPSDELQAEDCLEGFLSSFPSEAYDLEMAKLQRIFHIPTISPVTGRNQVYSQRESLQSSVITSCSPMINPQFSGTNSLAGEELLNIEGIDEFLVSGKPAPAASCLLHYHQL